MVKKTSSNVKAPTKQPQRKKPPVKSASSIGALEAARDKGKRDHLLSQRTVEGYNRYVLRGKEFLEVLVASKKAELEAEKSNSEEDRMKQYEELQELSKAFDPSPNTQSVRALELFITEKCFAQGCGGNTASGIHAGFKKLWDKIDRYYGDYHVNEDTLKVTGNPANAPSVNELRRSVVNRDKGKDIARNHAEAIRYEDLAKMMDWSESVCSDDRISQTRSLSDQLHVAEHLMFRAYASTAFTLWSRNSETSSIKNRHYKRNCEGTDPYHIPHDQVYLVNRKGWTRQSGNTTAAMGRMYEVYDQKDTPAMDMRFYMQQWLRFLEDELLKRPLTDEEYIFPTIGQNGLVHTYQCIDHNAFQARLNMFAANTGLTVEYTTHSFRRGGAQYRFQYCPLGKRWALSRIRWWGGWAEGEQSDTLMRYLLDELSSQESSHHDALCPIQREASQSFNGDHILTSPVTIGEIRELFGSVGREFQRLHLDIEQGKLAPFPSQFRFYAPGTSLVGPSTVAASPFPTPPAFIPNVNPTQSLLDEPLRQPLHLTNMLRLQKQDKNTSRKTPSVPEAVIPNLSHGPEAWREVIRQWEESNPITKTKALKDWPLEWYSGSMSRFTGSKWNQRKAIAEEYIRCNRTDTQFLSEFPEATQSIKMLLNAIAQKRQPAPSVQKGCCQRARRGAESPM
ncbi:hypothetical protein QCA50_000971 [Cerrena zonata]|uniref:Uncharacterized protein n=1 Tax=Cerrena zonata TaxID=2478898 RepID=A0AAW0GVT3_9APHY